MSTTYHNKERCISRRHLLPPIPENSGSRGLQNTQAAIHLERSDSIMSAALTPRAGNSSNHAKPAVPREWPAHREVRGEVTLKATADHGRSVRAVCSIKHAVLTLTPEGSTVVVAEVPVAELAVGLQRGRNNMFTIATVHQNKMFDEIFCFADDQVKRNKWIAVFRRMGVPVLDVSTA